MGKSPSIQRLEATNADFRRHIARLRADSQAQAADMRVELREKAGRRAPGTLADAVPVVSGQSYDFVHQKEFSLANLKNSVDAISKAVFAGGDEPPGANVEEGGKDTLGYTLGPAVGQLSHLETYLASKVFRILSGVILSFGTATSVTIRTDIRCEPLGYGLQLFSAVAMESFEASDFFPKDYVYKYLYLYDVRFSAKQARSEIAQNLIQDYQDEIAILSQLHTDLNNQLVRHTIDFRTWWDAGQQYDAAIKDLIAAKNDLIRNAMTSGNPALLLPR